MKKWLIPLLLLLWTSPFTALAFPAKPTTAGFVFDYANVLDDDVETELNEVATRLQQSGSMELFFITVDTIGDMAPYEYGLRFFREWGIGDADTNNGMVIFATTDMGEGNNVVRIATGYGLEGEYNDAKVGSMIDTYMLEALKNGDYSLAFAQVADIIRSEQGIEYDWQSIAVNEPMSFLEWFLAITIFGGMLVFCAVLLFRFAQRLFYGAVQLLTGKDIRTARYKRYLAKKDAKAQARAAAMGTYYDDSSSGSSDSYSGGGGDSGGGGSDRSF